MFDYLTKTSDINLKEFTVNNANYHGWESNLSIKPPRFFQCCLYNFNEHKPVRETYLKDSIWNDFSQ